MASLGNAYVNIIADAKKLKPGLDKARATVTSSVDKMADKIRTLTFQAAIVGAAAFSAAVVYNMKKAVDAASDLEEVTAKFGTVYKDQIVVAEKNAKVLVDSYGLSTRASKEYLGAMQDLLVPMGMASGAAAKMSNEVVKLSVDLGSFNNVATADVMRDIQSALVGNFETMKKYGVVLNQNVVAQEALSSGLVASKDQLDANTKAQAAYQLIVKGSTFAIGDWARTSGGFANQMKQLTSNIEDMRAELGNHLLPVITPVVKQMNDWVKANKEFIAQNVSGAIEKITASITGIKNIYDSLPGGVVGAAGYGIVGRILWGGWGPAKVLGGMYLINEGLKQYSLDIGGVVDSYKDYKTAIENIMDVIAGRKTWDTGQQIPQNIPIPKTPPVFTGGIGTETEGYEIYKPPEMGGDNTEADEERLALLNEQFYAAQQERLGLLAEIQEQEIAMWIEQNNLQIEMEKELQGMSVMQAAEAAQAKLNNYISYSNAEIAAEKNKIKSIDKLEKFAAKSRMTTAIGLGTALLNFAGTNSEAIFAITKGMEVGIAVMAAFTASNLALAHPPGPPTTIPLAAATLKAGLWNAAAIGAVALGQFAASSNSGGGSVGSGAVGGGTYTSPTVTTGVTDYDTMPEEEKRGTLTINIQGDILNEEYIDMIVEKINEADDRDVFINQTNYAKALS